MARGTVLVVDDDRDLVVVLTDILEMEGYRVMAAHDAAALQLAREGRPDLILLDVAMPGIDGVEISRRLRADPATADIPIIAMSAQQRLEATAVSMPVDDRIAKPFEIVDLYAAVARWVKAA
jgi:CheY-like chemotaxis protein